jgi:predicted GNAT family acetyltransferase
MNEVRRAGEQFLIRLAKGKYAHMEYHVSAGAMYIDSTFVPEEYRGRGLADALMKAAIEYAKENNLRIVPVCSYAKLFFERHPEHQYLL